MACKPDISDVDLCDRVPQGRSMQSPLPIVPGRSCGNCTLCCKVLTVFGLKEPKPAGAWCPHCTPGSGCAIHTARPEDCRDFFCGYLTSSDLGEEWKPSRSRFVIAPERNGNTIHVHVDPQRPEAWKQAPYHSTLRQLAKREVPNGGRILVWIGKRLYAVLPDRDVDLGVFSEDEILIIKRLVTPGGIEWQAFKCHKDDPRAREARDRSQIGSRNPAAS
jgi:hypothetical protein